VSLLTSLSPNKTVVPGAPRIPAEVIGVPGGLAVTKGGKCAPWSHHCRYSPRTHHCPGGGQQAHGSDSGQAPSAAIAAAAASLVLEVSEISAAAQVTLPAGTEVADSASV